MPYHYIISCPVDHYGIIMGDKGKTITKLKHKWNGEIHNINIDTPSPGYICIYGIEYAVHILALELNDMIKLSLEKKQQEMNNKIIELEREKIILMKSVVVIIEHYGSEIIFSVLEKKTLEKKVLKKGT